jgi:PKD domain-containing protein
MLLVLAVLLLGGPRAQADGPGGHDGGLRTEFAADADADTYTGPAPLTVRFSARTTNASGRVTYRWDFDDRVGSAEQNPSHTFPRHGWYNVTMDARDETGHRYRMNLLLHAWRPRDWARLQRGRDLRIVQHAARELERKRSRAGGASLTASGARPAS